MNNTHITASMTVISSDGTTPLHEKLPVQEQVSVRINYPKDFKGDMFFAEGHVEHGMAKDSAETLVKAGIATILAEGSYEPAADGAKPYNKMNKAELQAELTARNIEFDESETKVVLVEKLEEDDSSKDLN